MTDRGYSVLSLSTDNFARSILSEATWNVENN
ncbi:hypothetical protein QBD01_001516 [Ochrobactrum sp. 19YEA23]|nr:hypothetical protein [Ochrobactrum sp. 19YEA23]